MTALVPSLDSPDRTRLEARKMAEGSQQFRITRYSPEPESRVRYDGNKFAELVLYIAHAFKDDKRIGTHARRSEVLWFMIREGNPRLRIYYRFYPPGDDGIEICCLVWLEIDSDWAAAHLPR